MRCVQNFKFGVNGALISVNDGGYGATRFDSVTPNGTASPIYDTGTTHLSDPSATIDCGAGAVSNYVEWIGKVKGPQTDTFGRVYCRTAALPSGNADLFRVLSSANVNTLIVQLTSTGKIRISAAGASAVTSTNSVSTGAWFRLEFESKVGNTVQTVKIFLTPESATPDETITSTAVSGPADISKIRLGAVSGLASWVFKMAHIEFNNTGYPGPYSTTTPPTSTWYVSKNGNNNSGADWTNAWNELDQIDWALVAPGDTIVLDGGATKYVSADGYGYSHFATHATNRPGINSNGMLYSNPLVIQNSGTSTKPITFTSSDESGHNGTIVIFGGRPQLLPEANTASGSYSATAGRDKGIDCTGVAFINFLFKHRSSCMIYGCGGNVLTANGCGIFIHSTSHDIYVKNVEVFDCGTYGTYNRPSDSALVWKTDQEGISNFGGSNITLENCLIHDCGQDEIQGGPSDNLVLRRVWLFGRREHSTWAGYGFSAGCQSIPDQNTTHVDGIQLYSGGLNRGPILVESCIAGPFVNQGLYFGDGNLTSFDNVTIRDVITLAFRHGIQGDVGDGIAPAPGTTPKKWDISKVTIYQPSTPFTGYSTHPSQIEVEGGPAGGHKLNKSIITWGSDFYQTTPSNWDSANSANNFYSGTGAVAVVGGSSRDPLFKSALAQTNVTAHFSDYMAMDLTPQDATVLAADAGANLHSVKDLLNAIDQSNGDYATPSIMVNGKTGTLGTIPNPGVTSTKHTIATRAPASFAALPGNSLWFPAIGDDGRLLISNFTLAGNAYYPTSANFVASEWDPAALSLVHHLIPTNLGNTSVVGTNGKVGGAPGAYACRATIAGELYLLILSGHPYGFTYSDWSIAANGEFPVIAAFHKVGGVWTYDSSKSWTTTQLHNLSAKGAVMFPWATNALGEQYGYDQATAEVFTLPASGMVVCPQYFSNANFPDYTGGGVLVIDPATGQTKAHKAIPFPPTSKPGHANPFAVAVDPTGVVGSEVFALRFDTLGRADNFIQLYEYNHTTGKIKILTNFLSTGDPNNKAWGHGLFDDQGWFYWNTSHGLFAGYLYCWPKHSDGSWDFQKRRFRWDHRVGVRAKPPVAIPLENGWGNQPLVFDPVNQTVLFPGASVVLEAILKRGTDTNPKFVHLPKVSVDLNANATSQPGTINPGGVALDTTNRKLYWVIGRLDNSLSPINVPVPSPTERWSYLLEFQLDQIAGVPFRDVADGGNVSVTSFTVSLPTNWKPGDLGVIAITSSLTSAQAQWAVPAGWTRVIEDNNSTLGRRYGVFTRVLQAGDTGPTFSNPGGASAFEAWVCTSYAAVDPTTPVNASGITKYGASTNTFVCPSVTTTVAGCRIIRLVMPNVVVTTWTQVTSGTTVRDQKNGVLGAGASIQHAEDSVYQKAAGATGTITVQTNVSTPGGAPYAAAITLALAPLPSSATGTDPVAFGPWSVGEDWVASEEADPEAAWVNSLASLSDWRSQ